ncbi:class II D-tagatose-bisphosphate aldolase, non-catalytic subunit [Rheinheimera sp.]|uniref:class II D-tagatose-bisphosphate aldolase, non-catalytic subunit n=1 Tax=Rheinheimera sp. TaxID=1869214 RepID=UPI00307EFE51
MSRIHQLIASAKAGQPSGIYSVCSAHPLVLEAAIRRAKADQSLLLIEATANQVNQFGGYTGQTPAQFIAKVQAQAAGLGLATEQLIFGGDHLGPVVWRKEPAEQAMQKAEALIAAFVEAGFEKIHLDTSMACADDPAALPDEVIAERAARLCAVAERSARPGQTLCYVIGTEVPAPGGVAELEHQLEPTPVANVQQTLDSHQQAFAAAGLTTEVWHKVIALVVQPGVEFDNQSVHLYQPQQAVELSHFIKAQPGLVFEAHSTDYQNSALLRQLVQDQFAILKVGPELTLALREALFCLNLMEEELQPAVPSNLRAVCKAQMLASPGYWQSFYSKPDWQLLYSYSDRIRYYWPEQPMQQAVQQLLNNLAQPVPLPLIRQFMPDLYPAVKLGQIPAQAKALLLARLDAVLGSYATACGFH